MKLLRCPSALRSGSTRASGGPRRSASRAASWSSKARLPGILRSLNQVSENPFELRSKDGRGRQSPHFHIVPVQYLVGKNCVRAGRLSLKQGNHGNSKGYTPKDNKQD